MTSTLVIAGVAAAVLAWYALSCWWFPLAHCWCCRGRGSHSRDDGTVYRPCGGWRCWPRGCGGTGRRWRVGRRVWNFFRRHTHT